MSARRGRYPLPTFNHDGGSRRRASWARRVVHEPLPIRDLDICRAPRGLLDQGTDVGAPIPFRSLEKQDATIRFCQLASDAEVRGLPDTTVRVLAAFAVLGHGWLLWRLVSPCSSPIRELPHEIQRELHHKKTAPPTECALRRSRPPWREP